MKDYSLLLSVVDETDTHRVQQELKYRVQNPTDTLILEIGECVYQMNLKGEILSKSVPRKPLTKVQKIKREYTRMLNEFRNTGLYNTKEICDKVKVVLERKIGDVEILCDETNNPPNVINDNNLVARVTWKIPTVPSGYTFVDLIF